MKAFFIVLIGFLVNHSFAQIPNYFPNGVEWRIRTTNAGNYPYMFFQDDYVYYLSGDSTVGAHTYRKIFARGIYKEEYLMPQSPTVYTPYNHLKGLLRQEGRKIYIGTTFQQQFIDTLLYDFDLSVGDTLPETWNQANQTFVVLEKDSIWIDNSYRKKYHIQMQGFENNYDSVLVEGIGHSGGLLETYIVPWSSTNKLFCYAINGTSLYQGPYESENELCVFNLGMTGNISNNTELFPNPCTDVLQIRWNEPQQITSLYVCTPLGEKTAASYRQLSPTLVRIDVSSLNQGVYIMSVQTKGREQTLLRFVKN